MDSATPVLNRPAPDAIDLLLTRRSGSAKSMTEPGPSKKQLDVILEVSARAPDHGKLFPWRFIVLEGKGRKRAGDILAKAMKDEHEKDKTIESERERFLRAPVVVVVVSRVRENIKIPEWEQVLSAGAVCQNMLIASHALGFVANWLTEWTAYHPIVKEELGLKPGERIAGFIYIGSPGDPLEERVRPDMDKIVTRF
jgi:nitroreductase